MIDATASHFQAALSVNKNHQSANKRHPSQLRQQQKGSLKTIIPFQAETFAKPVTDGASAARRHFEKSVMLCLISNLATSCRRSILGFRLLLGVLQRFQAAYLCFCLNNRAYFANATQCLIQPQQIFLADRFACFQAAFVGEQG